MKKVLLAGTALVGLALAAAPAKAEVKLDLGGFFRGYGVYADSDVANERNYDLRRDSEVHVSGETTLDNGLTVGFHTEQKLGSSATVTNEVYSYFSGGWGRLNVGSEDGAAYLLQVAAPSGDSNVDGLRANIQAFTATDSVFGSVPGLSGSSVIDYDHVSDPTGSAATDRLTYITPKFNGFQAGVSYAPETGQNGTGNNLAAMNTDNDNGDFQDIWEAGARYDGEFQGFGFSLGAGYSHAALENHVLQNAANADDTSAPVLSDDVSEWNIGGSVAFSGFTLGAVYKDINTENQTCFDAGDNLGDCDTTANLDVDKKTWVAGGAYDNGPYHVGVSYLNQQIERDGAGNSATDGGWLAATDATYDAWTVGGGYTFGPGMTFRGAVTWGQYENDTNASDVSVGDVKLGDFAGGADQDVTQVTIGTDIQF